jgi:tellurite resistance protein TehA-like permease
MPKFIAFVCCIAVLIGAGGWPRVGFALVAAVVALSIGYGVWLLALVFFSTPNSRTRQRQPRR